MIALTTLNPKFSLAIVVLSLIGLCNDISAGYSATAFIIGALAVLPLIIQVWKTMKKNWPIYRKFYSTPFHKRDMKIVRKSWRLTWWIIPYVLIVYTIVDIIVIVNYTIGTPYSVLYGTFFTVFGYTLLQGSKYYNDVKKRKK